MKPSAMRSAQYTCFLPRGDGVAARFVFAALVIVRAARSCGSSCGTNSTDLPMRDRVQRVLNWKSRIRRCVRHTNKRRDGKSSKPEEKLEEAGVGLWWRGSGPERRALVRISRAARRQRRSASASSVPFGLKQRVAAERFFRV